MSLTALLAGCMSAPSVPAILVAPTAQTHLELLSTLRLALNDRALTLSDDALTQTSVVSFDHPNLRDATGTPIDGRRRSVPETFMLQKQQHRCVLVDVRTNRRWALPHARCEPHEDP